MVSETDDADLDVHTTHYTNYGKKNQAGYYREDWV